MSILVYPEYQYDDTAEQFATNQTVVFTGSQYNSATATTTSTYCNATTSTEAWPQANSRLLQLINSYRQDTWKIIVECYDQIGKIFNCIVEILAAIVIFIIGLFLLPIFLVIQLILIIMYIPFLISRLFQTKNPK
jgi:hypothetical protein